MSRLDPTPIARAILTAPGWARVGITAPSEYLREDAAEELARWIAGAVEDTDVATSCTGQLRLSF